MLPVAVTPIPGIPVQAPRFPPQPGQVIVAYETESPEVGCCKCENLTTQGLVIMIILILFFPVLACIPCCMEDCHTKIQRPVYGYPQGAGMPMQMQMQPMPMAQPVYQQ